MVKEIDCIFSDRTLKDLNHPAEISNPDMRDSAHPQQKPRVNLALNPLAGIGHLESNRAQRIAPVPGVGSNRHEQDQQRAHRTSPNSRYPSLEPAQRHV